LEWASVSGIPRKHAPSLQRLHSLELGCGTFAFAKDQAFLPLDGLLKEYLTLCSNDYFQPAIKMILFGTGKLFLEANMRGRLEQPETESGTPFCGR
jgi:hypothetical protein